MSAFGAVNRWWYWLRKSVWAGWSPQYRCACCWQTGAPSSTRGDGLRSVSRAQTKCVACARIINPHGSWLVVRLNDPVSQRNSKLSLDMETVEFARRIDGLWLDDAVRDGDYFLDSSSLYGEVRYGKSYFGWWSFGLLNSGILATAVGGWFILDLLLLVGHLCALGAVIAFILLLWPRVKPLGGFAASQG
jgi:hypothetical protein